MINFLELFLWVLSIVGIIFYLKHTIIPDFRVKKDRIPNIFLLMIFLVVSFMLFTHAFFSYDPKIHECDQWRIELACSTEVNSTPPSDSGTDIYVFIDGKQCQVVHLLQKDCYEKHKRGEA